MRHVILELNCFFELHWCESPVSIPECCERGANNPGCHCLKNMCPHLSFTDAPLEIAYSDDSGDVDMSECCCGFGGYMEPDDISATEREKLTVSWREICKRKIQEAWEDYMETNGLDPGAWE